MKPLSSGNIGCFTLVSRRRPSIYVMLAYYLGRIFLGRSVSLCWVSSLSLSRRRLSPSISMDTLSPSFLSTREGYMYDVIPKSSGIESYRLYTVRKVEFLVFHLSGIAYYAWDFRRASNSSRTCDARIACPPLLVHDHETCACIRGFSRHGPLYPQLSSYELNGCREYPTVGWGVEPNTAATLTFFHTIYANVCHVPFLSCGITLELNISTDGFSRM
jgi:hypothetical protein